MWRMKKILFYIVILDDHSKNVTRDSNNGLSCSCMTSEMKDVMCSDAIKIIKEAMHVKRNS